MSELPEVGNEAPDFNVASDTGDSYSLKQFRGKKVVLFFYPKDDTPGWTREACAFRDNAEIFNQKDIVLLGISADSIQSHQKFKNKYNLPFVLLADESKEVAQAYGVWQEKKNYGKTYMGLVRTTFVIDEDGKIEHVFKNVKVDGHVEKILELI